MKIAIDAMGGDFAPVAAIEGALLALEAYQDISIYLVGNEQQIEHHLKQIPSRLSVVHTTEVIQTNEEPVKAIRSKRDSSLVRAVKMVREKEVDACISAGNTGAYMAAGLLVAGRMKGVERPALSTFFPTLEGYPTIVLDVGANMDAKPEHLLQYAHMGAIFAEKINGIDNPRVGLLNVGAEESKGNDLTKKTFALLKASSLHFIGNVEGHDIPYGKAHVVVCEGFSGNIFLKTAEGVFGAISKLLKKEISGSWIRSVGGLMVKPAFRSLKDAFDYSEYGGAPLLGLNGICIKAHGSSKALAIKNAVRQARASISHQIDQLIESEVQKVSE
jgi:glycerol-3-phosphate acyltransferase PlsX